MQNDVELREGLLFLALSGSRAYGTSTPSSDYDLRGVGVSSIHRYFGEKKPSQHEGGSVYLNELLAQKIPEAKSEDDCVVFDLLKFSRLAMDANPNILELLFVKPEDWIFASPYWERLYTLRYQFLSLKVRHTYTGYAISQLKRIKTHRQWLLHPSEKKPTRSDFGLPENRSLVPRDVQDLAAAMLKKQQQVWRLDGLYEHLPEDFREDLRMDLLAYFEMVHGRPYSTKDSQLIEQAAVQSGLSADLFQKFHAERQYHQALHQWKLYQTWMKNRSVKRSKLEKDFGYDTKHASHLVRLLLTAEEILDKGELTISHPQADLLREVRRGAWSYDELIDWAKGQEQKIISLSKQCSLPKKPDSAYLKAFITDMIFEFHGYQKPARGLS